MLVQSAINILLTNASELLWWQALEFLGNDASFFEGLCAHMGDVRRGLT